MVDGKVAENLPEDSKIVSEEAKGQGEVEEGVQTVLLIEKDGSEINMIKEKKTETDFVEKRFEDIFYHDERDEFESKNLDLDNETQPDESDSSQISNSLCRVECTNSLVVTTAEDECNTPALKELLEEEEPLKCDEWIEHLTEAEENQNTAEDGEINIKIIEPNEMMKKELGDECSVLSLVNDEIVEMSDEKPPKSPDTKGADASCSVIIIPNLECECTILVPEKPDVELDKSNERAIVEPESCKNTQMIELYSDQETDTESVSLNDQKTAKLTTNAENSEQSSTTGSDAIPETIIESEKGGVPKSIMCFENVVDLEKPDEGSDSNRTDKVDKRIKTAYPQMTLRTKVMTRSFRRLRKLNRNVYVKPYRAIIPNSGKFSEKAVVRIKKLGDKKVLKVEHKSHESTTSTPVFSEVIPLAYIKTCCRVEHSYFRLLDLEPNSERDYSCSRTLPVNLENVRFRVKQPNNDKSLPSATPTLSTTRVSKSTKKKVNKKAVTVGDTQTDDDRSSNLSAGSSQRDWSAQELPVSSDSTPSPDSIPDYSDEDSTESAMSAYSSNLRKETTAVPTMPDLVKYNSTQSANAQRLILPKPPTLKKMCNADTDKQQEPIVSLSKLDEEIAEMEKLIFSKCDTANENNELRSPPKLTKITHSPEVPKRLDSNLQMPTLRKMVKEKMNWNVEYLEEEETLDKILVKASELNARNFTKAMERKLEPMEAEVTITRKRRLSFNEKENEDSSERMVKQRKTKLDALKRFVDEPKEKLITLGAKKPEIKVKTVELINEEFDDSSKQLSKRTEKSTPPEVATNPPEANESTQVVVHYRNGSFFKILDSENNTMESNSEMKPATFKRSIPVIINRAVRKGTLSAKPEENSGDMTVISPRSSEHLIVGPRPQERKLSPIPMRSIEQKILKVPELSRFVKLVPYEPPKKPVKESEEKPKEPEEKPKEPEIVPTPPEKKIDDKIRPITLSHFTRILQSILPEKWFLSLDPNFGLQIIKTHLDEMLNPSIIMSVVVGRNGKVMVNVRGRQLDKTHELFKNLGNISNSEDKISINYILAVISKLKFYGVCCGCNDLSLKKYWNEDGFIEYYTEFQQTYRSHVCDLLIPLGKKRCYPCFRMNDNLRKRYRKDHALEKPPDRKLVELSPQEIREISEIESGFKNMSPIKEGKRNLEAFLEVSFSAMKKRIEDELEKRRDNKEKDQENVPTTQEEVLSFMGLTRKDVLDKSSTLRKSKREKRTCSKYESSGANKSSSTKEDELEFLEKHWADISTLFSTSLLFGAYSRTSCGRLRVKCKTFQGLLKTWRAIIKENPHCISHDGSGMDEIWEGAEKNEDVGEEDFGNMDLPELRAYVMSSVKEVNQIKFRLKQKNQFFKLLYDKYVKKRVRKQKRKSNDVEDEGKKMSNTDEDSRQSTDVLMFGASDGE